MADKQRLETGQNAGDKWLDGDDAIQQMLDSGGGLQPKTLHSNRRVAEEQRPKSVQSGQIPRQRKTMKSRRDASKEAERAAIKGDVVKNAETEKEGRSGRNRGSKRERKICGEETARSHRIEDGERRRKHARSKSRGKEEDEKKEKKKPKVEKKKRGKKKHDKGYSRNFENRRVFTKFHKNMRVQDKILKIKGHLQNF